MAESTSSSSLLSPPRRNALQYVLSAREQQVLYKYLASRSISLDKRRQPSHTTEDHGGDSEKRKEVNEDDYNAASVRISLRLFLASYSGLKAWENLSERLFSRGSASPKPRQSFFKTPAFRLSLSLSALLVVNRILHRFLLRLRSLLLSSSDSHAASFRRRNPRITRILTSRLTPSVGASTSSLALLIAPADQTRLSIAIYAASRSLEFVYNALPSNGLIKSNKPSWLGSWCLMPLACAQLLHAFVFDRDCFPATYGSIILRHSPEYIQQRPQAYPTDLAWPATFDIVDALAKISESKWPKFTSPILFPAASYAKSKEAALAAVAPVVDPAHPAIQRLSCAVLHPADPSCGRTFLKYFLSAFPATARFFAIIYALFALPRYKTFINTPAAAFNKLARRILETSLFFTASVGGAWSSICLLQRFLPGHVMPTSRWYLSGFLAGFGAWFARKNDRSNFFYSARMSADSLWKVGKKHGWWKSVRGGDVLVFWASMALLGGVYQRKPEALEGPVIRKAMGVLRGEGWVDRAVQGVEKDKGREKEGHEKNA